MTATLAYFATPSEQGKALKCALATLLAGELCGLGVQPIWHDEASQSTFYHACLDADVVVFDASLEPEHDYRNYLTATAQPMALRHILVVSRTYLPQNFQGLRRGGAPAYPGAFTNDHLIAWLTATLLAMRAAGDQLPRPSAEKGLGAYMRVLRRDLLWSQEHQRQAGQVFISYRNAKYTEVKDNLIPRLQSGALTGGTPVTVNVFAPGELAFERELLSGMRRWQIVGAVDRAIGDAGELWVYGSAGHTPYIASWWTQSEIAAVIYRRQLEATKVHTPPVRYVDPAAAETNAEVRDVSPEQLPVLSPEHAQRMSRLYASRAMDMMGCESARMRRFLESFPALKYLRDEVWTPAFWENELLQCDRCSAATVAYTPGSLLFDMAAFLMIERPLLKSFTPAAVAQGRAQGYLVCPDCQTRYTLTERAPRYWWYAERIGRANDSSDLPIALQRVTVAHAEDSA